MEDETANLVQKVAKIDLNKDEKEAEQMIKRAMNVMEAQKKLGRTQKAAVFKALTDLNARSKSTKGAISLKEIRAKVDPNVVSS